MVAFTKATVTEVLAVHKTLQEVRVERHDGGSGDRAYVQTALIGEVAEGDEVILNVTAVELSLGTGGWHFVHWNLGRDSFERSSGGHAMKLRYTSLQHDVDAIEESAAAEPAPVGLDGTPVVCAPLLSQAAIAAIVAKAHRPKIRIALVVSDQTALGVDIAHVIRGLKDAAVIAGTITCGQAFGGDHEAITFSSAVLHARSTLSADLVVATQGPGSLGTASRYGFSIFETARMLDDVAFLGGKSIFAVRWSGADKRPRHQGLSHHSRTILERAADCTVAIPGGRSALDIDKHRQAFVSIADVATTIAASGVVVSSMGRSIEDDPDFFDYAAAAGTYGAEQSRSSSGL